MQARYYAPSVGRFVSSDKIVPDALNPQALNRYSYVLNNPVSYSDPTGHAPRIIHNPAFPGSRIDELLDRLSNVPEEPNWDLRTSRNTAEFPGVCMGYDECRFKPVVRTERSATEVTFSDEEGTVIVTAAGSSNGSQELNVNLHEVLREKAALLPGLSKTGGGVKSEILGLVPLPLVGPLSTIVYDLQRGDKYGAAENVAEEGLEHWLGKLLTDLGGALLMAPYNAYKLDRAMRDHGENVEKMFQLNKREYDIRSRMGDPDARFNLYRGWQMGPAGQLLRHGEPVPRVQTGNIPAE
jgi:uncharacterized protein RhaS with RHS repeats